MKAGVGRVVEELALAGFGRQRGSDADAAGVDDSPT